jgi:hypothetical protein
MTEGSGSISLTNGSGSATLKSMLSCIFAGEAVQGHQAEGEEQGGRPELSQKENGDYRGAAEPGTYLPRSVIVSREWYRTVCHTVLSRVPEFWKFCLTFKRL